MRKVRKYICQNKQRAEGGRFNYELNHQNGSPEIHSSFLCSTADHLFNNNVKIGTIIHVFIDDIPKEPKRPLIEVDPAKEGA